ncbi:MAG: cupin domain-containing protein, partial [Myxococcales bacterium]|nr:cupin domain-containing protein [Myxococcales bacterium]
MNGDTKVHGRPRGRASRAWIGSLFLSLAGCGGSLATAGGGATDAAAFAHTTASERGQSTGPAEWFTGTTTVSPLFAPNGSRDFGAATVVFEAGARTAWHTHPAGQTLVVTEGTGWVQLEGEARVEIHAGDVVWIPPGIRHWHGATATSAMTHVALQGAVDGSVVDWLEHVTD